jgi:Holliday junction resolvase RusA-like endonuclease
VLHFIVPGPPFAWRRAQTDQSGRRYTDKDQQAHQRRVAGIAALAMGERPPLFCAVKLLVIATFELLASGKAAPGDPHDIKPDGDNLAKQIADALMFVAFVDDAQVADTRSVKLWGAMARTEVWLEPMARTGKSPAAARREVKWRKGGYDAAIAKAPCGPARWPSVLDAYSRRLA